MFESLTPRSLTHHLSNWTDNRLDIINSDHHEHLFIKHVVLPISYCFVSVLSIAEMVTAIALKSISTVCFFLSGMKNMSLRNLGVHTVALVTDAAKFNSYIFARIFMGADKLDESFKQILSAEITTSVNSILKNIHQETFGVKVEDADFMHRLKNNLCDTLLLIAKNHLNSSDPISCLTFTYLSHDLEMYKESDLEVNLIIKNLPHTFSKAQKKALNQTH